MAATSTSPVPSGRYIPRRDGVPVADPSRRHLLRQVGRDVLQMDVDHAIPRVRGELDRIGPPDHQMAGVDAQGHGRGLQQALDVLGSLDDRAVMGMEGDRRPRSRAEIDHPADPAPERRPCGGVEIRTGLIAVPTGAAARTSTLGAGRGHQVGLRGHPRELLREHAGSCRTAGTNPATSQRPCSASARLEP